jgi:transcriptional regulator with GAF, ATPase, and Fis domain
VIANLDFRSRILLVRDDKVGQETLRALQDANWEVLTARSGEECLQALRANQPDMVVFDANGQSDSTRLSRLIKSDTDLSHTLVVVLARTPGDNTSSVDFEGTVDSLITGSISAQELVARIRPLLRIKKTEEALRSAQDLLEQRVQERTLELVQANQLLQREIEEHRRTEEELRKSCVEIEDLKNRLQAETDYLKAEAKVTQAHGGIAGESAAMQKVLQLVEQVAPTTSSVLLVGETGTGKELIAQAIHDLSPRKNKVMVKVNCAALPQALVESELFGRERGAYTGALTRQAGRFEIADGSTLFLDEIGELPPEVQVKLLRVLQEGQFERLGNPKPFKVDVRLIAATNRDLPAEIRKGRFREDLYYRLNVFPINVPALRDRPEDVPVLAWTFIEEFSARMGKKITKVPQKVIEMLQHHPWPGNVRQLRNVIEHSVIITPREILKTPPLEDFSQPSEKQLTLAETEREHILHTLELTRWRIKGANGAAARLDIKPSTLYSRMEKLGIPTRLEKDKMPR